MLEGDDLGTNWSLRDFFAALALPGIVNNWADGPASRLAGAAYEVADAMLDQRLKNEDAE
jgi:hypothetical protein